MEITSFELLELIILFMLINLVSRVLWNIRFNSMKWYRKYTDYNEIKSRVEVLEKKIGE